MCLTLWQRLGGRGDGGGVGVVRQGQSERALGCDRAAVALWEDGDPGTGGQTDMFSCLGESGD